MLTFGDNKVLSITGEEGKVTLFDVDRSHNMARLGECIDTAQEHARANELIPLPHAADVRLHNECVRDIAVNPFQANQFVSGGKLILSPPSSR